MEKSWVYLMKDLRSDFYKIGFSTNPSYREKTLQAEQPAILLVDKWEGTVQDEKTLHKKFESYRIRGEWFVLSKEHISAIYRYFCDKATSRSSSNVEAELRNAKTRIAQLENRLNLEIGYGKRLQRELSELKNQTQTQKPEFILPPRSDRGDLLRATKLSKLPSLPKRDSIYSAHQGMPGKPQEPNYDVRRPVPWVYLRFNSDNPQVNREYTDEVPF